MGFRATVQAAAGRGEPEIEYDYGRQVWVTGEPARLLRIQHLSDDRTTIAGPRGLEFLRFTGRGESVAAALAVIDAELARLRA